MFEQDAILSAAVPIDALLGLSIDALLSLPLDATAPTAPTAADRLAAQLRADAWWLLADFGESVTYLPGGDPTQAVTLVAVVDRNPPAVVQENGQTLADDVELTVMNGGVGGVVAVAKRDIVIVPGRFGGPPRNHTVTALVSGDAGTWTLRVR